MTNPENLHQRPNILAPSKRDKTGEPRPEHIPINAAILYSTGVTLDSLKPLITSVSKEDRRCDQIPMVKPIIFPWED